MAEYNNGDQIRSKDRRDIGDETVYTVIGKSPRGGGEVRIVVAYRPKNGGWYYIDYGKDFLDKFYEPVTQEFEVGKTYSIRVGTELDNTFAVFAVEDDTAYGILTYPDGSKAAADRGQHRYPLIVESVIDDGS